MTSQKAHQKVRRYLQAFPNAIVKYCDQSKFAREGRTISSEAVPNIDEKITDVYKSDDTFADIIAVRVVI
jgi:hypothetical protein